VPILFIDLASHHGVIACTDEDRVVASIPVDHRIDDVQLVPQVESILKKARCPYQDLTHIACVVGPGGFTSLRVAVALANVLSHELRIPACGIHLSDIFSFRVTGYELRETCPSTLLKAGNSKLETVMWLHSTKKHELFICSFGDLARQFPEPVRISIDDLRRILSKDIQWMGELIPEHQQIADEAGAGEVALKPLEEVLPLFLKRQIYKEQILTPWYGRRW